MPQNTASHALSCSPIAHSRTREFLYLSLCSTAEISISPWTPSSGKGPSPLQPSHLQNFAGKRRDSGKAETWLTASCIRQEVRASVVGDESHMPCPTDCLGKVGSC